MLSSKQCLCVDFVVFWCLFCYGFVLKTFELYGQLREFCLNSVLCFSGSKNILPFQQRRSYAQYHKQGCRFAFDIGGD